MLIIKKFRLGASIVLAGLLNLAGCGQTGPLYLPPKLTQVATPAVAAALPIIAQTRVF
jgi:predicted small lipoprotein YifL